MNRTNTFVIPIKFCILIIILLAVRCSCDDYYYEVCVTKSCVYGPDIRYPFYISGQQEPFCGYDGFELRCSENGYPILHLRDNDYIIQQIYYDNSSLRVHNAAFDSSGNGCLPQIGNITLVNTPFRFENVSYLSLLSDCNTSLPGELLKYKIGCDDGDEYGSVLAMFENDENLDFALTECKRNVEAPVEVYEDDGDGVVGSYQELMRRGFVLNWTASDCSECEASGGRCGFNRSTYSFMCFCRDRPHHVSCKPESHKLGVILGTVFGGAGFILIICSVIFIMWRRRRKRNGSSYILSRNTSSDPSSRKDLEAGSEYPGVPVFSYAELAEATNNFDASKELGDGGFGIVYYGKLRDGREVAVKRLYEHNYKRVEQFRNEIKILTGLRHQNLVSLYGCTSRHSRELLLVYEFVHNGTVADHLHGEKGNERLLNWPIRMNIAVETASALTYLHASDIIHRDVKTNNILLDRNFCVKVADFGLSRLFPNDVTHVSTAPQGTPGYVDPEYHECYQLTDKSDVYSFGVVLIELISSLPAVDISRHRQEINLANLAINRIQRRAYDELIDPSLGYASDPEVKRMTISIAELAFQCLQIDKELRPKMDEVLEILKDIKEAKEEFTFEKMKKTDTISRAYKTVNIPLSPDPEDAVLLKNMKFLRSPNSVTDAWISSSSTVSGGGLDTEK